MDYPKWVYSKDGSALVHDETEHLALGDGWHESPADVPADGEDAPKRRGRPPKS